MSGEKRVKWTMTAEQSVTQTLEQIAGQVSLTDAVFAKLGGSMKSVLAGLSIGALLESIHSVIEAGDQANKAAQKVGVTVEAWQKLSYAAKLADVSQESLAKGLKNLGTVALQAKDGGADAQDTFKRLGVTWLDAAGQMKGSDQLLLDMADRFSKMPDGIEKTALATKVFGKAGMDLIPFLNAGRDGIQDLMDEAEKLGIVMDSQTAAASEALNDNLTRLTTAGRGLLVQGVAPLIPFLSKMSNEMVTARKEGEGASRWTEAFTTGLRLVTSAVLTTKTILENLGNTIGAIGAAAVALAHGSFSQAVTIIKEAKSDNEKNIGKLGGDLNSLWNGVAVSADKAKTGMKAAGASMVEVKKDVEQFQAVLDKVMGKSMKLDPSFQKDLKTLFDGFQKGYFGKGDTGLEAYRKAVEALIKQQPFYKKQIEENMKDAKELAKYEEALAGSYDQSKKAADDQIGAIYQGNKDIAFETSLINKSTLERDLAINSREKERAMLKAMTPEQRALTASLYDQRAALIAVRDAAQAKPTMLEEMGDLVKKIGDDAKEIGNIFQDSFGRAGQAVGGLTTALAQYAQDQQTIAEQLDKQLKDAYISQNPALRAQVIQDANNKSLRSEVSMYAGMASAAKGFFSENSKGYKVMEATEKAFRAVELALSLQSFATKVAQMVGLTTVKATTTASNMALEQTETATSVQNSATKATASTIAGAGKSFEQMGVYGFIGAAAILAFMMALGVNAGGGGAGANVDLSKDRQDKQGTGTVLGDPSAKSKSIENSLQIIRDNSNDQLTFTSQMLGSLRAIEANMKGLAALAARIGLTGQGVSLPSGGGGNSFSLADSGIILGTFTGHGDESQDMSHYAGQTVAQLTDPSQLAASRYDDVARTHSGALGSTYTAVNRDLLPLEDGFKQQLAHATANIRDALANAVNILTAGAMSVEEVKKLIDTLKIDPHEISFKDLKGDDIQAAIQSVFSAIGDDMATGLMNLLSGQNLDALAQFQQVGEGAFETVVRVANGIEVARDALSKFGIAMIDWKDIANKQGDVATEIIRDSIVKAEKGSGVGKIIDAFDGSASDLVALYQKLVDLRAMMGAHAGDLSQAMIQGAHGLDAFTKGAQAFHDRFFTAGQQIDEKSRDLQGSFAALGLQMPATNDGFKKMLDGIDTTTEAGQTLYGALIALAPAFADVTDAAKSAMDSFDQLMGQMRGPGYTAQVQTLQRDDAVKDFMNANGWTKGMTADQVIAQLRTISRDDFAGYSQSNKELILSILGLTNSLDDNTKSQTAPPPLNPVYLGDPHSQATQLQRDFDTKYKDIIAGDSSSRIDQYTRRANLLNKQADVFQSRMTELEHQFQGFMLPTEYYALQEAMTNMRQEAKGLGVDIGSLTVLTAQYGQTAAEQLFDLQKWYDQQKTLFAGNNDDLLALDQLYAQKRADILTKSIGDLDKARGDIGDWLQKLFLGDASPLDPGQRLAYARQQYLDNYAQAQKGDVGALQKYTGLADDYIKELRSSYGSGLDYLQAFAQITQQGLGLSGLADARPVTAADTDRGFQNVVDAIRDLQKSYAYLNGQVVQAVNDNTKAQKGSSSPAPAPGYVLN